jgi:hypothetical protein
MPCKTMDVEEQKVRFVVAATRQERSFSALCQEFGISRPTGCLWRKRYQEAGLAGIAEQSRRPWQSPTRTAAELEQRVVQMRQRYPDWGASKLWFWPKTRPRASFVGLLQINADGSTTEVSGSPFPVGQGPGLKSLVVGPGRPF